MKGSEKQIRYAEDRKAATLSFINDKLEQTAHVIGRCERKGLDTSADLEKARLWEAAKAMVEAEDDADKLLKLVGTDFPHITRTCEYILAEANDRKCGIISAIDSLNYDGCKDATLYAALKANF